jgi:oligoribonuclease NrnB/cAMP/cGMP phosphodiesterase (DHH superfamily)
MRHFVFYHANCNDGFGAAYAAWLKFGDEAEYLAVQYGQCETISDVINLPKNAPSDDAAFYILDFSFPLDVMHELFERAHHVTWLDHHKTAFEMMGKDMREVYRVHDPEQDIILDNSKSGAVLAWEFFQPGKDLPTLLQMIDDRDRWQFKLSGSKPLHAGLSQLPYNFKAWHMLTPLGTSDWGRNLHDTISRGDMILSVYDMQTKASVDKAEPCSIVLDEAPTPRPVAQGLAVNTPQHISEVGHHLANKSGTYGLIWWYDGGTKQAVCSLRSNGDYDVSAIAKLFGGGGHKNAAGFKVPIEKLMEWL